MMEIIGFVLGLILAPFVFWSEFRRRLMRKQYDPSNCPSCGRRFSEWFVWGRGGLPYCWPCWDETGELHMRTW